MTVLNFTLVMTMLAATGCATVLREGQWRSTPPQAACVVTLTDGEGSTRERRYDAAGHLLFGTTGGRLERTGFEWLHWQDDRVVAIETFSQTPEEGDEPARREIERMDLRYERGLLTRIETTTQAYVGPPPSETGMAPPSGPWMADEGSVIVQEFVRDGKRLTAVAKAHRLVTPLDGFDRLEYVDGRVVRKVRVAPPLRKLFGDDRDREEEIEWKDGRVSGHRWGGYLETFAYDDAGRLEHHGRRDLADKNGRETTVNDWSYGPRGVITRMAEPGHRWQYQYDAAGHLLATRHESGFLVEEAWSYRGDCDRVFAGPPPPDPLQLVGARACIRSQARFFEACD